MFDQCLYFNTTALARIVEREWNAAYQPFDLTAAGLCIARGAETTHGIFLNEGLCQLRQNGDREAGYRRSLACQSRIRYRV